MANSLNGLGAPVGIAVNDMSKSVINQKTGGRESKVLLDLVLLLFYNFNVLDIIKANTI